MVVANIVLMLAPRTLFPHFHVHMGRGIQGVEQIAIREIFLILFQLYSNIHSYAYGSH